MTEEELERTIRILSNQYWVRYFRYFKEGAYLISIKDFDGRDIVHAELSKKFKQINMSGMIMYEIPRLNNADIL